MTNVKILVSTKIWSITEKDVKKIKNNRYSDFALLHLENGDTCIMFNDGVKDGDLNLRIEKVECSDTNFYNCVTENNELKTNIFYKA